MWTPLVNLQSENSLSVGGALLEWLQLYKKVLVISPTASTVGSMETPDKNIFPKIELFHPLRTLGHLLLEGCSLHLLSPRSEHFEDVQAPFDGDIDDGTF